MGAEEIRKIKQSLYLSTAERDIVQSSLLQQQAVSWLTEGNFFRERLLQAGISQPEQLTLESLPRISTCDKNDMAVHGASMTVQGVSVADICTTSGSTGKPVPVPLSLNDIHRLGINEALSYTAMELEANDKILLCTTIDRGFMAGMAYMEGARAAGMTFVRGGIGNPAMHWDYMLRFGITALITVPSFVLKLLEYAILHGIDPASTAVKRILCIGEPLRTADSQPNMLAQEITRQWNVQLFSTYASTEMQTAFTECKHGSGGHHVPSLIICEFLDDNGNAVHEDEAGELTITHLGVEAMPLLRFRTGDMCYHTTETCACGRTSLRITAVAGRKNEMLKYKGTTFFPGAIVEVLNATEGIRDFIIRATPDHVQNDHVEIWACGDVNIPAISERIASAIRVKPPVIITTQEEIEKLRSLREARKLLRFIDLRN